MIKMTIVKYLGDVAGTQEKTIVSTPKDYTDDVKRASQGLNAFESLTKSSGNSGKTQKNFTPLYEKMQELSDRVASTEYSAAEKEEWDRKLVRESGSYYTPQELAAAAEQTGYKISRTVLDENRKAAAEVQKEQDQVLNDLAHAKYPMISLQDARAQYLLDVQDYNSVIGVGIALSNTDNKEARAAMSQSVFMSAIRTVADSFRAYYQQDPSSFQKSKVVGLANQNIQDLVNNGYTQEFAEYVVGIVRPSYEKIAATNAEDMKQAEQQVDTYNKLLKNRELTNALQSEIVLPDGQKVTAATLATRMSLWAPEVAQTILLEKQGALRERIYENLLQGVGNTTHKVPTKDTYSSGDLAFAMSPEYLGSVSSMSNKEDYQCLLDPLQDAASCFILKAKNGEYNATGDIASLYLIANNKLLSAYDPNKMSDEMKNKAKNSSIELMKLDAEARKSAFEGKVFLADENGIVHLYDVDTRIDVSDEDTPEGRNFRNNFKTQTEEMLSSMINRGIYSNYKDLMEDYNKLSEVSWGSPQQQTFSVIPEGSTVEDYDKGQRIIRAPKGSFVQAPFNATVTAAETGPLGSKFVVLKSTENPSKLVSYRFPGGILQVKRGELIQKGKSLTKLSGSGKFTLKTSLSSTDGEKPSDVDPVEFFPELSQ